MIQIVLLTAASPCAATLNDWLGSSSYAVSKVSLCLVVFRQLDVENAARKKEWRRLRQSDSLIYDVDADLK